MTANIEMRTDANGLEMILLTDPEKYSGSNKGLPVKNILIHAATGEVFHAPPGLHGLSRLSEADCHSARVGREVGLERPVACSAG